MVLFRLSAGIAVAFLTVANASAQADKYNVTPEEHAACDSDAFKFCGDSQDQDELLVCMKAHRTDLTQRCQTVFVAGLKSRHISLK